MGDSERVLGLALADGYREKVRLVTKLPMFLVRKAEDFDKYLDRQLKKLNTDRLDIYMFHAMSRNNLKKVKELGLLEKMEEAVKKGKVLHPGFSFHDTLPAFKEIVDLYPWDAAQIQYNYMDTGVQAGREGLQYAAARGMAVIIMEPLKGGRLVKPPAAVEHLFREGGGGKTPVEWALQYLWNLPEVSVVLSGMNSIRDVDENCSYAERSGIGTLSPAELGVLNEAVEIFRRNILVPCTACRYCLPCPQGVAIPENFAILNNSAMKHGIFGWLIKRKYKKLARVPKKLTKLKDNGSAVLCNSCGLCVPKCTQNINIPEELKKANAILGRKEKIQAHFNAALYE